MRRKRSLKELRQKWHKEKVEATTSKRKRKIRTKKEKPQETTPSREHKTFAQKLRNARAKSRNRQKDVAPAVPPFSFSSFKIYDDYKYNGKKLVICHIIESLGLGGAQTMMMELVNGLNRYYGDHCDNIFLCVNKKSKQSLSKTLYRSYGISPQQCRRSDLFAFCDEHKVDVVVHHRISLSDCVRSLLPPDTKYILINHTWNRMDQMRFFRRCDAYVSVCKFLHDKTKWAPGSSRSRRFVILNGIENNYLDDIEPANLEGDFITGRCHRLTIGKFKIKSIDWLDELSKKIPGFHHHLIGAHKKAKARCSEVNSSTYHGAINNLQKKMSMIKAFDVYFYDTYADEGASIALLESLAAGVPVLTKGLGGCPELVVDGLNGYIVNRPDSCAKMMKKLARKHEMLKILKKTTLEDFNNRLHVRHTACKYMQLFEALTKNA